jgi:hypothetical protein
MTELDSQSSHTGTASATELAFRDLLGSDSPPSQGKPPTPSRQKAEEKRLIALARLVTNNNLGCYYLLYESRIVLIGVVAILTQVVVSRDRSLAGLKYLQTAAEIRPVIAHSTSLLFMFSA